MDEKSHSATTANQLVSPDTNSEIEQEAYRIMDKLDYLNVILSGKLKGFTQDLPESEVKAETDVPLYYTPIGNKFRTINEQVEMAIRKVKAAQL